MKAFLIIWIGQAISLLGSMLVRFALNGTPRYRTNFLICRRIMTFLGRNT